MLRASTSCCPICFKQGPQKGSTLSGAACGEAQRQIKEGLGNEDLIRGPRVLLGADAMSEGVEGTVLGLSAISKEK